MAMGQYFQEPVPFTNACEDNGTSEQKCKSGSATVDNVEDGLTGCFDCNICLDFVHDPVVTLCGHLYCWPCIYKWICHQSGSGVKIDDQQPQCPVCKAVVSKETLVPLYGRGLNTKPSEAKAQPPGMVIPQRPSPPRCESHSLTATQPAHQLHYRNHQHHRNHQHQPQPYYSFPSDYSVAPMVSLSSTTATNPVVGVFGEMVYARLFGTSEMLYNPNSYNIIVNSNPRYRRHLMEADKSLGRLLFFLCCCMVVCLLLF